jgi:MFS family permease
MFAGAAADRVNRRTLLMIAFLTQTVLAFIMATLIATGSIQLLVIIPITFLMGCVSTFDTAARQALVVDIAGHEDAMASLSMSTVALRVMGVVGGGIAGWLIGYGTELPYYVMSLSYLTGFFMLLSIRGVAKREGSKRSVFGGVADTFRILRDNPNILALAILATLCEVFGWSYSVVLPVYARDILDVGSVGLGMLNSAQAIGGLAGAFFLASLGNFKYKGKLTLGIFLAFGLLLIAFSHTPWYFLSLALVVGIGAVMAGFNAMQHTLLQLNVGEEQRGKAMGIWLLSIGSMPLGSLIIGAVADAIGAPLAVLINGLAIIVIFIAMLIFAPSLRKM